MKYHWKIALLILSFLSGWLPMQSAYAVTLNSIDYNVVSSQNVQVVLQFSGPIKTPKNFDTKQPPRIILDFFDVDKSKLPASQNVNREFLTSVNSISADGRTRIIMNLTQGANYSVSTLGSQATITLFTNPVANVEAKLAVNMPSATIEKPARNAAYSVKNIDFRRNDSNGGDVIINLSSADVVTNVNQENNTVDITLMNTSAPSSVQNRLDVADFATPVQLISTRVEGSDTHIQIQAKGGFEQMAYQVNKQFVVSVNPISAEKLAQKQAQPVYTGKPISLNFQDIPIRSVLEVLANFTGINIVATDGVKGNITLRLNNIPWDEALAIVLKAQNLGKKQMGNTIMIAPADSIAAQEKQDLKAQQDVQQLQPLQTQYIRLNYAKAEDMATLIKDKNSNLLSERGNVTTDKRTNTLIVQDTDSSLMNIQNLVAQLDIAVQQVLIEARIVNVDTSFEQDLGIRWGLTKASHVTGTLNGANQMMNGTTPAAISPLDDRLNVDLGAHATGVTQVPSVGIALANLGGGVMLDLELSAIETENGAELISSPRVVTANQHPAYIEQGQEIPYQQQTSSGATAVEFKKAVLSLRVTPQITPDNKIILDIKVTQDTVDPLLQVQGVPAINTREIETNVLVSNGETIVLGGIYEEDQSHAIQRVPWLGSIPYFGALFRNKDISTTRRELLIFITPKVVQQLPVTA